MVRKDKRGWKNKCDKNTLDMCMDLSKNKIKV